MKLILLVVWTLAFPDVQIHAGWYETEKECSAAFAKLDESTSVALKHECRVDI